MYVVCGFAWSISWLLPLSVWEVETRRKLAGWSKLLSLIDFPPPHPYDN